MPESRHCTECNEIHLLRSNGLMSIHQNAAGERCEVPESRKAREREERASWKKNQTPEVETELRRDRERGRRERDAAYAVAAGAKKGDSKSQSRPDRSIYAVGWKSFTPGGLPDSKR